MGLHTLLNVVAAPFLPAKLDPNPAVQVLETAMQRFPEVASLMGLTPEGPWKPVLESFSRDLNVMNPLTPLGRKVVNDLMLEASTYNAEIMTFLSSRLTKTVSGHPATLPRANLQLVWIVGNYRSGTTILQRLLSTHHRAVFFPQWVLKVPITKVSTALEGIKWPNLPNVNNPNDAFAQLSSEIKERVMMLHPMAPEMPEEDGLYWGMHGFAHMALLTSAIVCHPRSPVNRDSPWINGAPSNREMHELFFTRVLPAYVSAWLHADSPLWSMPGWKREDKRFVVLKAPFYATGVDLIKKTFPGSVIIATHRAPVQQSLAIAEHWWASAPVYGSRHAFTARDVALNSLRESGRMAGMLARHADLIDVNVGLADLRKDPLQVAKTVLAKVGVDVGSSEDVEAMRQVLHDNKDGLDKKGWKPDPSAVGVKDWNGEVAKNEGYQAYLRRFAEYI